jgi:hypothetical protein
MKKLVLAGALALAMMGTSLSAIAPAHAEEVAAATSAVSATQISQLKSMLNLTAAQQAHWPAVVVALRRVQSSADTVGVNRLIAAARPLLRTLDENQKRTAMRLAQSLGFAHVAAAAF